MKSEKVCLFRSFSEASQKAEMLLDRLKIPYYRIFTGDNFSEPELITNAGDYREICGVESYSRVFLNNKR